MGDISTKKKSYPHTVENYNKKKKHEQKTKKRAVLECGAVLCR